MKLKTTAFIVALIFSTLFNLLAIRHCHYLEESHVQAEKVSEIASDAMKFRATLPQITTRLQSEFTGRVETFREEQEGIESFSLPKNTRLIGGTTHWTISMKFDAQGKCERAWIKNYIVGGF